MAPRLSIDRERCHSLAQVPAVVRVQHDHRVLRQLQAVQLVEDLARRRVRPRNLCVHTRSCQRSMSGLGFATTSEHAEDARSECMSGLGFEARTFGHRRRKMFGLGLLSVARSSITSRYQGMCREDSNTGSVARARTGNKSAGRIQTAKQDRWCLTAA